jgi:hypothetical protein
MCRNNCVCALDCICCGVKNETRTVITELLTSLICSASVDLGIEFGCNFKDSKAAQAWLKEAILSTSLSVACITICSTILRIANHKYRHNTESNKDQINKPLYFSIALALSEFASACIAFGLGIGLDYLIENTITHKAIKNWKHSAAIPLALLAPAGIALAKTASRLGIFKLVNWGAEKICNTNRDELYSFSELRSVNSSYTEVNYNKIYQ